MVYSPPIDIVEETDEEGLSVKLVLHERDTKNQGKWTTVSWRSVYPNTNNQNRYTYLYKGKIWGIPITLALKMMNSATFKGLLDMRYDDKYKRLGGGKATFFKGTLKKDKPRFSEICLPNEESIWASDTVFMIAEEPGTQWRKVMIASNKDNIVTFRTLTRDISYKLKQKLKNNPDWYLDRSMMDCDTAVMREFRNTLKRYAVT